MDNKKTISRRDFLKIVGITTATTAAVSVTGCMPGGKEEFTTPGGMTYRSFPKYGDKVSLLGFGMMRLPLQGRQGEQEQLIDQEAVNELVDYAIAHGVNYFDTSPVYVQGWSEKSTGIALKRHPREKLFIATKLSNFSDPSRENSIAMYRQSFIDLQVDYIDYYLLHSVGSSTEDFRRRYVDNGMLAFLQEERKAGRIRRLGWSFHGRAEVFDEILAMHDEVHWDFVQIQLNYSDWHYPTESFGTPNVKAEYLYGELEKRNIPVTIMEPLLGGRLSNVPQQIAVRLKQQRPEDSVASWAFRFAGTHKGVLAVLSGMTFMEHLQDNLRTFSPLEPLTQQEMDFLDETARLMRQYPTIPCNDCKYCMPCPYGLDIPAILLHYNKCVNEDKIMESRMDENYKRARREFLIGYDRSVPKLRQASHCIGCRQCVSHCPQSIDIPAELHRIDDYVESLKQETL